MILKNFQLLVSEDHFPGYKVTQPFYIYVQYELKDGTFGGVRNITIPFSAVGTLYNSNKLKQEIEAAALNNFNSLVKRPAELVDMEVYNNLKSQINY